MRKIIFFFSMLALGYLHIMAGPIDVTMARQKAEKFLQARGKVTPRLNSISYITRTVNAIPAENSSLSESSLQPLYIFNQKEGQGFVVVAGDDRAGDILAYSDRGCLDLQQMPEGLKTLLDGYAQEINLLQEQGGVNSLRASDNSELSECLAVTPLIETRWGQGSPYNAECSTSAGKQAAAGYGATALAQLLYYYRGQVVCSEIPTYITTKGETYDALEATIFDWQSMLTAYGEDASSEAKTAVAHLMLYAGRAMKTAYGNTSSSADIVNLPNALSYFGFQNEAILLDRQQCGVEQWDALIYHELQHGRPVVYMAGNALNSTTFFVCDGYDGHGLFHLNWGREGNYDGYYRLQAINASALSTYGYSTKHCAVVGICPTVVNDEYGTPTGDVPSATYSDLEVTEVSQVASTQKWKVIRAIVLNHGTSDYAGTMRLQLNGTYLSTEDLYVAAGKDGYVDFIINKAAGTYMLKLVEKKSGKTIYQEENFTLSDMPMATAEDIQLMDYQMLALDDEAKTMYGSTLETRVTLSNSSENSYYGKITLTPFVTNEDQGTIFLIAVPKPVSIQISLQAGETKTFSITSYDLSVGDTFYLTLETPGETIYKGDSYHPYTVVEGYRYWDNEGVCHAAAWGEEIAVPEEAVAVSFERMDLSTVSITPNANPNTIYYVSSEEEIPASLSSCNVVCNGKAVGDIVIHESYDYCIPMAFYVGGKVSTTRIFTEGSNGWENWHEMTLPYSVQTVTANGKTVDWCHGHNGKGFDFWVMAPTTVSDGTLHLEAAKEWLAAQTYFIAVPDGRFSSDLNLCGKTMSFDATGIWMAKSHSATSPYEGLNILNDTTIPGDVNNDGILNITDVVIVVDAILGSLNLSLPLSIGDMEKNNFLNITDVVTIVDRILGL